MLPRDTVKFEGTANVQLGTVLSVQSEEFEPAPSEFGTIALGEDCPVRILQYLLHSG